MEQDSNEIRPGYGDRIINEKLASAGERVGDYSHHFNQNEEYFIEFSTPVTIPRFPIHHDVRQPIPSSEYITALRKCVDNLLPHMASFMGDLTYFFDPQEILKPCFYRLYKMGDSYYLYLLRLNLQFRPLEMELLERGTNDVTPLYRSRRIYVESDVIPLQTVLTDQGHRIAFKIKQSISQTWIGETGKGYLVRGIWMDTDLTKFFSKLFIPQGKRIYPFYPFTCKYKTICMTVLDPTPEQRKKWLPYLRMAILFLEPHIEKIERTLRGTGFSENLPLFQELKALVPDSLTSLFTNLEVSAYLNHQEQKEFRIRW
ncbi:MAG: hypothetical protein N2Z76_05175 [Treponemataceae bacterium]|nr:hypothetical protein [Treponemataceae bacterium]